MVKLHRAIYTHHTHTPTSVFVTGEIRISSLDCINFIFSGFSIVLWLDQMLALGEAG